VRDITPQDIVVSYAVKPTAFSSSGWILRDLYQHVTIQVLTTASMKIRVFWDAAPCSLVEVDRRFRDAYCLHHQDDDPSPWWWRHYAPLKRRSTCISIFIIEGKFLRMCINAFLDSQLRTVRRFLFLASNQTVKLTLGSNIRPVSAVVSEGLRGRHQSPKATVTHSIPSQYYSLQHS